MILTNMAQFNDANILAHKMDEKLNRCFIINSNKLNFSANTASAIAHFFGQQ
jgi:hypothetical protein